ncbi:hypothetical protein BDR06DRAFT_946580 [Suillus hirtellus]|nr:hypothetical protein BDR06DRAFT_946580 [Suillus hirtellus]
MPSSMTRNTTPLLDYHVLPTPQTSLPNSVGGLKKKKAKSDILLEAGHIQDEIKSMHSDAMLHHNSKHQCFLVKLDVKSEHHWDLKKYEWLHVHQAHLLVLDKEAKTLWLKIQFHQMTQGNRTPVLDGAM